MRSTTPVSGKPFDRFLEALNAGDETLSEIFRRHSDEQPLPYESFARRVRMVLNAESCAIFLVRTDGSRRALEFIGEDGDSGYPSLPIRLPIQSKKGGGLTSHLANCGRIVRLHGTAVRENSYRSEHQSSARPVHSLLAFPLKNRNGKLLGLVKVRNKLGRDGKASPRARFTDTDVGLAAFLSNRLALALESLQFVNFFNTLISGKSGLSDLSLFQSSILHQALGLVGADGGSLALWDERKEALITCAQVGNASPGEGGRIPRHSVVYDVWTRGRSISIPDVRRYKDAYYSVDSQIRSVVAVPLAARDTSGQIRPIGVLSAGSFATGNFDVHDCQILEAAAGSLANAIDSTRRDTSLLGALADLSAPARVFIEKENLLSNILERVRDTYGFDRGVVYIAEEMSSRLRLGAQIGCDHLRDVIGKYTLDTNTQSIAGLVWQTGKPIYSERPRLDPRVSKAGFDPFKIQGPLLALPMIHSGKTLGVLICWSRKGLPPRPEHLTQLAPYAQVAAAEIAIWHAHHMLDELIHNIAQPAQNIGGLVQSMRGNDVISERRTFLPLLTSETERLVSIVRRTRMLREYQLVPSSNDRILLDQVVENTSQAFRSQADEIGITLAVELPPDRESPMVGDAKRVGIALSELINNALKHSKAGDTVRIRLVRLNNGYEISVADQGKGIPEAYSKDIFTPYFTLQTGDARSGTGLGLTIAHGIVEQHGGTLRYSRAEVGSGAVFTVCLPTGPNLNA